MHELSVIMSIVQLIKDEVGKRDDVRLVKEVHLEVGELTFLGHKALEFGFRAVITSDPIIDHDALRITTVKARVKCLSCDYEGPLDYAEREEYHLRLPRFCCPECGGEIEILEGKECIVKNFVLDVEEA